VRGASIPLLIDELPLVALLAALCEGETRIDDAAELRLKESDRLATTRSLLQAMQVDCEATEQGLIVRGRGGSGWPAFSFDAAGDHRLAMAAAVAALGATGPCTIDGAESINVSYPGFVDALIALGAHVERSQA
jgi:3-phosphoshikimate 1-carboxyvinyltransferase